MHFVKCTHWWDLCCSTMEMFWKWCLTMIMYLVNSPVPHPILWDSPFREGSTTLHPSMSEQLHGTWQTFSVVLVSWQASKFRHERGDCFYHLPHPQRLSTCLGRKLSGIHLCCIYPQPGALRHRLSYSHCSPADQSFSWKVGAEKQQQSCALEPGAQSRSNWLSQKHHNYPNDPFHNLLHCTFIKKKTKEHTHTKPKRCAGNFSLGLHSLSLWCCLG